MKERTDDTIRAARRHVAKWLRYCHRRSGPRHRLRGRAMICTGCAYDAVAEAIEEAVEREWSRSRRASRG